MNFNKVKDCLTDFFKQKTPSFFKNNFEIFSSKPSKITGLVICIITLLAVVLDIKAYITADIEAKWILLVSCLIFPFVLGLVTAFTIRIKNDLANKISHYVFLLVMPILAMTMTECLNNVFIFEMTGLGFLGNYIVLLILYFIFFAITGNFGLSYLIVTPVVFGLATAHSYIMDFRGTPFQPMDFLSITTAVGVANTYDYTPTYKVMTATLLFILIIIIGVKTKTPKYSLVPKIILRCFSATFATVILVLFFGTSVFANMGVRPDFWNQTRGYKNYGFVFNFFANTKYLYMSEPDNYDPTQISEFVNSQLDGSEITTAGTTPNIICIMNETLSDLKVLGNLTTNEEYMPFMNSLTENTIKGNLYVPVIGAGTSNTEFEFLTGHTTAFLPSGSNAYMLYIKNPLSSMVSTLKAQNYSSFAIHPYYAAGWNRPTVYRNFAFNTTKFLEDIIDITLMDKFKENGSDPDYLEKLVQQKYPNSNMLLRQYISDSYNYKLLIEDFESRNKSQPYFAFNVTMQNHGGYSSAASNFNEQIYSTSSSKAYTKANRYLSLIKESDNAFKELIAYFSKVKEPTIICMFGDHQPSIETEFIAEHLGVKDLSDLTVQQEQQRHATPFIIWANYDIEEQTIDKLSSNYLSSLVLKTAGVKLTKYNQYLLKLSETLPVINTVGYIDYLGNYYKWSDTSPYTKLLSEYERIQYNSIFDPENINNETFFLEGYVHAATPEPEEEE